MEKIKVAFLMGSDSDFSSLESGIQLLKISGIDVDVFVMSAHRTPQETQQFAMNAESNGYKVIIAAAGKAAHLAGVIAANTILPVIGVPMQSSAFLGLDSLLSTVQMPKGIPVATVAVNDGYNAAILAMQIIATFDLTIREELRRKKMEMAEEVMRKNEEVQQRVKKMG